METMGLGAGSYPSAPEKKTTSYDITIVVEYKIKDYEFPYDWDRERIEDDIRSDLIEYIQMADKEEIVDIDI